MHMEEAGRCASERAAHMAVDRLLSSLLIPLANGGFVRASETISSITGVPDRRIPRMTSSHTTPDPWPSLDERYQTDAFQPPPSAQAQSLGSENMENKNPYDTNNISLEDLEDIDEWEAKYPRAEKQPLKPVQDVKANPEFATTFHMACTYTDDRIHWGMPEILADPITHRFEARTVE